MGSFCDLIAEIKKRPTLYLSRYSIFDFQSFYYGYDLARNQLGLPKSEQHTQFEKFLSWVRTRYNSNVSIVGKPEKLPTGCIFLSNRVFEMLERLHAL